MVRLAVVGDSVAWGQGLLPAHKYFQQLAAALGPPTAVEVVLRAHSGAVIGARHPGPVETQDPEVPVGTPTILAQLADIPDPSTVDLLLLNGGINDVEVWKIVDPLTRSSDLRKWTWQACYNDMKTLLVEAAARFKKPDCLFVVTGYYPILSKRSDLLTEGGNRLEKLLGLHGLGIPFLLPKGPIIDQIVSQCLQFWKDSDTALRQAVNELRGPLNLGPRLMFVPAPFTERNALFADTPWLFGIGLGPEDEVVDSRQDACAVAHRGHSAAQALCGFASVGHPNVAGAAAIGDALRAALQL